MNEYPKWVQRAQHIGSVLCTTEDEEKQVLNDWKAEQSKAQEEAKDISELEAEEAEDIAEVPLRRPKGRGR
jgi:hypothetical protein